MNTTQIIEARSGAVTDEMYVIARMEGKDIEYIREKVASGRVVILKNNLRTNSTPIAIGEGLKVKVNVNIGTTNKKSTIDEEIDKVRISEQAGADALMDLSTGSYIDDTRTSIIQTSHLPVGTCPIYQTGKNTLDKHKNIAKLSKEKMFSDIEKHCKDGVDFITVHCALTRFALMQLQQQKRLMGIVSKGGAMLACWMEATRKENPLYENFDELLDLLRSYDVVLSIGSALRPGCTQDSFDRAQSAETIVMGELVKRARETGVQVMVEGGGHIPLDKIIPTVKTIKEYTDFAPLFIHGPIVCDCAIGYDHITGAIGSSLAAYSGANFICSSRPMECLESATTVHIKNGITAAKISAQSADLAQEEENAVKRNKEIAIAKTEYDWKKQTENSIDATVFDGISPAKKKKPCTMCGAYCSMKSFKKVN